MIHSCQLGCQMLRLIIDNLYRTYMTCRLFFCLFTMFLSQILGCSQSPSKRCNVMHLSILNELGNVQDWDHIGQNFLDWDEVELEFRQLPFRGARLHGGNPLSSSYASAILGGIDHQWRALRMRQHAVSFALNEAKPKSEHFFGDLYQSDLVIIIDQDSFPAVMNCVCMEKAAKFTSIQFLNKDYRRRVDEILGKDANPKAWWERKGPPYHRKWTKVMHDE